MRARFFPGRLGALRRKEAVGTVTAPVSLQIGEAAWLSRVMDYAKLRGWLVHHQRPARTAHGWASAIEGDPGFPDLVLARDGVVVIAELKRHGKHPTPAQKRWLAALGEHAQLWTPMHWDDVVETLR
jgi:hypothetical protein